MLFQQQDWKVSASAGRSTGMKAASYATKLNANAGSAKRSQSHSAATFQAALEYRRQQRALADTAAVSAAAAEAASGADALAAATDTALAAAAAAKTAAAALEAAGGDGPLGPVSRADAALPAGSSLNGAGTNSANGSTAQRAQQEGDLANGRRKGSQLGPAATNGVATAPNDGKRRVAILNGSAQPNETQRGVSGDTGGVDSVDGQLRTVPHTNGLLLSPAEANGVLHNTSGTPEDSLASALHSSASEVADDAMTAAIAGIHSQQADAGPKTPPGAKAIPTPSLNASPRIKSALLAAQEYRKQKAAKTAALAIAAANAAKKMAKPSKSGDLQ